MINNLTSISKTYAASVLAGNLDAQKTNQLKEELDGLFSKGVQFYNTGSADVDQAGLKVQIELLEAGVEAKKKNIEDIAAGKIQSINNLIEKEKVELISELNKIDGLIQNASVSQNDKMKVIIDEVVKSYIKGDIKEDQIGNAIADKLKSGSLSNMTSVMIKSKIAAAEDIKVNIEALVRNLIPLTSQIDTLYKQIDISQKLIGGLKTMLNVKTPVTSQTVKAINKNTNDAPIYIAAKLDLINKISRTYGKDTVAPGKTGDQRTAEANPLLVNLGQALGDGEPKESILQDMFDEGFTYKEAAYAIAWMFTGTGVLFDLKTDKMSIPYGHGVKGKEIYTDLLTQMKSLWGADVDGKIIPGLEDEDEAKKTEETTTIPPVTRTDPIGFNNGNTSFDFVIDSNNDNVFNGKEEFLGAAIIKLSSITDENMGEVFGNKLIDTLKESGSITCAADLAKFDRTGDGTISGVEQLFMYDIDGDGVVNDNELENLIVLRTNQTNGQHSFMSATMAGIKTIDLQMLDIDGVNSVMTTDSKGNSALKTGIKADINGNVTENTFGVTLTNGRMLTGYQRYDNNNYLDKMYNGAFGANFTLSIKDVQTDSKGEVTLEFNPPSAGVANVRKNSLDANKLISEARNSFLLEEAQRAAQIQQLAKDAEAEVIAQGKTEADAEKEKKDAETKFTQPYSK